MTGAVECVTGAAAAGAELDGERSLSLASSELSELNPSCGIPRMIGKEGGGAEDSFGVTVVVTIDRCFFFGRESPAVVDFYFGFDVSPSGSRVVV